MRRPHLTYANAVSSLALFIALGGSSYAAITLPRNSVGSAQIRTAAVTGSEIKNGAIHSTDIAKGTRTALHGAAGPTGPAGAAGAQGPAGAPAVSYFAAISPAGVATRGDATSAAHVEGGSGSYTVGFARSVSSCAYTAVLGGTDQTTQAAGYATVRDDGGKAGVQTYDTAGNPADRAFHLIVAC